MNIGKWNIRSPIGRNKAAGGTAFFEYTGGASCPVGYVRLSECPEIQTPVNRIAELISSMTLFLMENSDIGNERVKNELSRMVDITPNRYMNHKEFYYAIVKNMLLDGDGNSIVYPKTRNGLLEELIPMDMSGVSILQDVSGYGYRILYKGKEYSPDEVLHFRANPNPQTPWIGNGYRVLLRDVAKNLTQAQKTKKDFMENPKPSVIVKVDAQSKEFEDPESRRKMANRYISDTENGRPWFLPGELMEVEQVKPLSIKDIALNDSVMIDKKTAAAIFGVPPFFVGAGEFKKEEYNAFINMVILPLAKSIEQEMTRKLLYNPDWFFKFNVRSLLSYDLNELIAAGRNMVDRMAMKRNEWRDWVGLAPRDDMEELLALENFIPADRLGDQAKLVDNDNSDKDKRD